MSNTFTTVDSRSTAELCRRYKAKDATAKDRAALCRRANELIKKSQMYQDERREDNKEIIREDDKKKKLQKKKFQETKKIKQKGKDMALDKHTTVRWITDRFVTKIPMLPVSNLNSRAGRSKLPDSRFCKFVTL